MEKQEEGRLPEAFLAKLQTLLGEEAEAFFKTYGEERRFGLRVNPLKESKDVDAYVEALKKIPWAEEGYYYDKEIRPGKHPFHEAGAFYIQEPSAMAVAEALEPKPGERILDLCAAPGGKSTHVAGKMGQKGLLVCNEIHPARAKILSQNMERMGIGNAVVSNMEPAGLLSAFPEFFDGIIVDAPCSGEGMFRKDEAARAEWSPDHVRLCADRQDGILDCAARLLKSGGRLVYSTCTFSPEENEQTMARFLKTHPEFSLERPKGAGFFSEGRPEWADGNAALRETVRIWPHKAEGEGHFLALLRKGGESGTGEAGLRKGPEAAHGRELQKKPEKRQGKNAGKKEKPMQGVGEFETFARENLRDVSRLLSGRRYALFGENLYLIPEEMPELSGLRILRPGLQLGTVKKGRLEPSHALALFLKKEEVLRTVELGCGAVAEKYLRGETLSAEDLGGTPMPEKGWVLATTGGLSLGFLKAAGGILKNHYPKGLRRP